MVRRHVPAITVKAATRLPTASAGDQLLIGVDVEEGDTEYANLLLRPQATNLVGLQLEMEPADLAGDDDEDHVHGPDCNH